MPVNSVRQEYSDNIGKWLLVKWFVNEDTVNLPRLLRTIDRSDTSAENADRNKEYKDGAVLTNVVKRTHDGMVGAVYRKTPFVELPSSVSYLEDNANGQGVNLIQFSKKLLSNTMQFGRGGVLVDFPPAIEGASVEETRDRSAVMIEYTADQVINWKESDGKLSLIVLKEVYLHDVDGYVTKPCDQYRELRLEDGFYIQRLWIDAGDGAQLISENTVTDYNGNRLAEITFTFTGTLNNDSDIDQSLLYSIAAINKGHFRNSADLEENCFIHGQLTLGITSSLDFDSWKEANPNGIKVGSRRGHYLGANGGLHSVQAEPNQLADALMARKEQQMISVGARLIQPGGNEREVTVLSRIGSETATLSSLADNISAAIGKCVSWCEMYMSPSVTDNIFELNKDFFPKTMDAQQVMALIQLYDRGAIGPTDIFQNLQAANIIADNRTIEDVTEETGNISPLITSV